LRLNRGIWAIFAKAALPRPVELDERLCAHVAGHVGQPWDPGTQRRQVIDLIEGRRLGVARFQLHQSLRVSAVPEPAKRVLPGHHAVDLRG
jgi:hypothetical protein